jgi:tRNA-2-methylthio-N6-dimethylallyladenosine synthase
VEEVQARIAFELNQPLLGSVEEVLVEEANDAHGRQQWKGRNRTNKLVYFPQPSAESEAMGRPIQPGDLVKVQIERATSWSLQGCAVAL